MACIISAALSRSGYGASAAVEMGTFMVIPFSACRSAGLFSFSIM